MARQNLPEIARPRDEQHLMPQPRLLAGQIDHRLDMGVGLAGMLEEMDDPHVPLLSDCALVCRTGARCASRRSPAAMRL
jgi:hypothetical protein